MLLNLKKKQKGMKVEDTEAKMKEAGATEIILKSAADFANGVAIAKQSAGLGLIGLALGGFASILQANRFQDNLNNLNERLKDCEEKLKNVTEAQFQLIIENVTTMRFTFDEAKLEYLKQAIINGVNDKDLELNETMAITRLLRDITVEELLFTIEKFNQIDSSTTDRQKYIPNDVSDDFRRIISGLAAIGVVAIFSDKKSISNAYQFTPIVSKLVTLLSSPAH